MEVAVCEMEEVVKPMARNDVYLEEEIGNLRNTNSTPKFFDQDLNKQEQKVFAEKVNGVDGKVEGKVKSSKSNKKGTIKKGDQLKGGEGKT